jgi:hypothetical protein
MVINVTSINDFLDNAAIDVSTQMVQGAVSVAATKQNYPEKMYIISWTYSGKETVKFTPSLPAEIDIDTALDTMVADALSRFRTRGLDTPRMREGLRSFGVKRAKLYAGVAADMLNTGGVVTSEQEMSKGHSASAGPECDTATVYAVGMRHQLTPAQILERIKLYYTTHP